MKKDTSVIVYISFYLDDNLMTGKSEAIDMAMELLEMNGLA